MYDQIYDVIAEVVVGYGIPLYYADRMNRETGLPEKRIYLDQDVGTQTKHTLRHGVYKIEADLLCEVHVPYNDIEIGKDIINNVRRACTISLPKCGVTVDKVDMTKRTTTTGITYVVTVIYNYLAKVL